MNSNKLSHALSKLIRKASKNLSKEYFLVEGFNSLDSLIKYQIHSTDTNRYNIEALVLTKNSKLSLSENLSSLAPLIFQNPVSTQYNEVMSSLNDRPSLSTNTERNIIYYSDERYISSLGSLKSNKEGLALVRRKPSIPLKLDRKEYILILDEIKDPGNLGTIIRTADWYSVSKVICSNNSVDYYNSKCIQSTMGSFLNVKVYYTDLVEFLKENSNNAVYGTFPHGENIYEVKFPEEGLIIVGNESHGISERLMPLCHKKISIPKRGKGESLNAAIATAICMDNIFRY